MTSAAMGKKNGSIIVVIVMQHPPLGLRCSAWLALLGSTRIAQVALLGLHWSWAADKLACTARLQPRAKMVGEGRGACNARLLLLGLCWGWVARLASLSAR